MIETLSVNPSPDLPRTGWRAAGESLGMDRLLTADTVKKPTHSLFRQGCHYHAEIPMMELHQLEALVTDSRLRREMPASQTRSRAGGCETGSAAWRLLFEPRVDAASVFRQIVDGLTDGLVQLLRVNLAVFVRDPVPESRAGRDPPEHPPDVRPFEGQESAVILVPPERVHAQLRQRLRRTEQELIGWRVRGVVANNIKG